MLRFRIDELFPGGKVDAYFDGEPEPRSWLLSGFLNDMYGQEDLYLAEIAKAESNIDDIDMESGDDYTYMRLIIQINNRQHLAQVMRGLRHIKDIIKITRIKD